MLSPAWRTGVPGGRERLPTARRLGVADPWPAAGNIGSHGGSRNETARPERLDVATAEATGTGLWRPARRVRVAVYSASNFWLSDADATQDFEGRARSDM